MCKFSVDTNCIPNSHLKDHFLLLRQNLKIILAPYEGNSSNWDLSNLINPFNIFVLPNVVQTSIISGVFVGHNS